MSSIKHLLFIILSIATVGIITPALPTASAQIDNSSFPDHITLHVELVGDTLPAGHRNVSVTAVCQGIDPINLTVSKQSPAQFNVPNDRTVNCTVETNFSAELSALIETTEITDTFGEIQGRVHTLTPEEANNSVFTITNTLAAVEEAPEPAPITPPVVPEPETTMPEPVIETPAPATEQEPEPIVEEPVVIEIEFNDPEPADEPEAPTVEILESDDTVVAQDNDDFFFVTPLPTVDNTAPAPGTVLADEIAVDAEEDEDASEEDDINEEDDSPEEIVSIEDNDVVEVALADIDNSMMNRAMMVPVMILIASIITTGAILTITVARNVIKL